MTHFTKLFTTAVAALMLFGTTAFAGNIMVKLEGRGDITHNVFGKSGLYLGDDWYGGTHPYNNWHWEKPDVLLTIFEDGDAQITGNQIRDYNGEIWGIEINLRGLKEAGSAIDKAFDMNMLDAPSAGFDWAELDMTLTYGGYSSVPRENWVGLAMPDIGHHNVAEIRWDDDGNLKFDAWYQHILQTIEVEKTRRVKDYFDYKKWKWVYKDETYTKTIADPDDQGTSGHHNYKVGDTKAYGWVMEPDDTPEIPTPAALPAGLALLGLAVSRRRNRK